MRMKIHSPFVVSKSKTRTTRRKKKYKYGKARTGKTASDFGDNPYRHYVRHRIRPPEAFKKTSFRTLDIGKPKRHMLVRGRLKTTGEWETQSVLVEKGIKDGMTKKIIEKAKKYQ